MWIWIQAICGSGGRSSGSDGVMVAPIHTNVGPGCIASHANAVAPDTRPVRDPALPDACATRAAARKDTVVD